MNITLEFLQEHNVPQDVLEAFKERFGGSADLAELFKFFINEIGRIDWLLLLIHIDASITKEELISSGADINATDDNDATILMWASNGGFIDIVGLLIDSGADVSDAALVCAREAGYPDIVKILEKALNQSQEK